MQLACFQWVFYSILGSARSIRRYGHRAPGIASCAYWLPLPPFYGEQSQAAFAAVLGSTWRIVLASLTAYIVSSLIDVQVFAWWRKRVGRHRWGRVLVSNSVSTLIDSAVFIGIAFAGVMPLVPLIRGQYIVKMTVTIVSIPLIYLVRSQRDVGTADSTM